MRTDQLTTLVEVPEMDPGQSTLAWLDYTILAGFLGISVGIGVYHAVTGGRQRTTAEFILGNRQLSVVPTALSLFVSFQSAIMILGMTAEMYAYGTQMMLMGPVAVLVGVVTAERVFVPWMYRMKLVSVNEVYRHPSKKKIGSTDLICIADLIKTETPSLTERARFISNFIDNS